MLYRPCVCPGVVGGPPSDDPVFSCAKGNERQVSFIEVFSVLQEWRIEPIFTHHVHTACLSAVAASDNFVATGSKDETIQLYNMKTRSELGALLHHDGKNLGIDRFNMFI